MQLIERNAILGGISKVAWFNYIFNGSKYSKSRNIKDAEEFLETLYLDANDLKTPVNMELRILGNRFVFKWEDYEDNKDWKKMWDIKKLKYAFGLIDMIYDRGQYIKSKGKLSECIITI